jgi:hypothetical protein
MLRGIQSGSALMIQLVGSLRLNARNLPFDNSSASSDPVSEHLVIFSMVTEHHAAVLTTLIAFTSVVQRPHFVL